jgi:ADP-L-glycero-D-manno-heptose 6-epimerase
MIVVTGANGFIGSALVWHFNQMGRTDMLCVDTVLPTQRPELLSDKKFSAFFSDEEFLQFLHSTEAKQIEWIVHMGACASTTEKDWEFLKRNNVEYTQTLFQWCAENGKPIIFASSAAVYGDGTQGFDDALDPNILQPLNLYGRSKVEVDRWVLQQKQLPPFWCALRFFNVYGPGEYHKKEMSSVVYKAFHQICESGRLRLFRSHHPDYADGCQKRDFIYVKDIAQWIGNIIERPITSGIYNMGTGEARTWLDLASAVFRAMKVEMAIDWIDIPTDIRKQYQYFTEATMDRLRNEMNATVHWPLEAGIQDYVQHYLQPGTLQLSSTK